MQIYVSLIGSINGSVLVVYQSMHKIYAILLLIESQCKKLFQENAFQMSSEKCRPFCPSEWVDPGDYEYEWLI